MFDEQRQARERLGAAVAGVLLELGVRLQVRAQVGPVGEGSAALRTGERAFARVRAKMSLEQPRPRERLAAQLAPTRQRVCPDVHLQRAGGRVRFVALRTTLVLRLRRLPRLTSAARLLLQLLLQRPAVELAVLRQSAHRRVALLAGGASEQRRRRRGNHVGVGELEETAERIAVRHGNRSGRLQFLGERSAVDDLGHASRSTAAAAGGETVVVGHFEACHR